MAITAPERSRVPARGPALDPSDRRAARIAGVLFILTFVTAIAARILFDPIGTALVVFPILRRQNETLALGYVAARLVVVKGFKVTSPILARP